MEKTTTETTKTEKMDLASHVDSYRAKHNAHRKTRAKDYVETALIPHLNTLAIHGTRAMLITPPSNLDSKLISQALMERVECTATVKCGGRIKIHW
jgi:hypothetical protein